MRFAKILGGFALATVALLAIAGSASATVLTSSKETIFEVGTKTKVVSVGEVALDGTINIKCKKSGGEAELTDAGSSTTTTKGKVLSATFEECGSNTVTVVSTGTTEGHTATEKADGNGSITATGGKTTVLTHNILGTIHCIYVTNGTSVGVGIGSKNREGQNATMNIESAVPRESTDFGCGSESVLTAVYKVETPAYVDAD